MTIAQWILADTQRKIAIEEGRKVPPARPFKPIADTIDCCPGRNSTDPAAKAWRYSRRPRR